MTPQVSLAPHGLASLLPKTLGVLPGFELSSVQSATPPLPFMDLVSNLGKSTRDSLKAGEDIMKAAARGDADPQDVAIQVLNAKSALHQFTTLVHASLQAYQEVMRMGL
jgi:flagellar hook-basal body complex protein FliE